MRAPRIVLAAAVTLAPWALQGWTTAGPPLPSGQQAAGIVTDPREPNVVYASDSKGFFRSDDHGSHWTQLSATSLTSVLAIDPREPDILYAGNANGGVEKTIDGGHTWDSVDEGLTCTDVHGIAVSPSSSNVVYAAAGNISHSPEQCGNVFRSDDFGAHWWANGWFADSIAVDPSSPDIAYAISFVFLGSGLARTTDGGASWENLSFFPAGAFAIDPANPHHLYASGILPDDVPVARTSIYESLDRGDSWQVLSRPDAPLLTFLLVDPANPGVLFGSNPGNGIVGGGVFRSGDGGRTWQPFGLENEPVASLSIDARGEFLHASVSGKGIFDTPISRSRAFPAASSGSATVPAHRPALIP